MAKARARLGALLGVAVVGGVLALGLVDCAEPTQIEIDVRTDACGVLKNAGIAVTTPEKIDTEELRIFTPERPDNAGCEAKPADRVGTLFIYPSGAKDAEVAIRIVGGISRTVQECRPGDYAGCVVARRIERFVPGTTKKVIVILSRACEGKDCGLGRECTPTGNCVVNLPDGGTEEAGTLDAQIVDAPADGPADAPNDAIVDAGVDACASCTGPGMTCSAGACTIDCGQDAALCSNREVCAPGLDCQLQCNAENSCVDVGCAAGAKSCRFDCTNGNPACSSVRCVAPYCFVNCSNMGRCAGNITLGGTDAGLICSGANACGGSPSVTCDAATCTLSCSGASSCPASKTCAPTSSCVGGSW